MTETRHETRDRLWLEAEVQRLGDALADRDFKALMTAKDDTEEATWKERAEAAESSLARVEAARAQMERELAEAHAATNRQMDEMVEWQAKAIEAEASRDALALELKDMRIEMSYLATREYDENPSRAWENRRKLARTVAKQLGLTSEETAALMPEAEATGAEIIKRVLANVKGERDALAAKVTALEAAQHDRTVPDIRNGLAELFRRRHPAIRQFMNSKGSEVGYQFGRYIDEIARIANIGEPSFLPDDPSAEAR